MMRFFKRLWYGWLYVMSALAGAILLNLLLRLLFTG